jgi:glycosyltransferase involved in cell wall biosynthesis
MKIGFDAKRYFHNQTGLGNYSRWLIDGLKHLHECHLYTPKQTDSEISNLHLPTGSINRALPWFWRSRSVCKDLVKHKIDVFHGLSNELPFGIHKTGIKSVVTIHDLINLRYPENYSAFDAMIYRRKLQYATQYADYIVTPSVQTKNDILKFFPQVKSPIEVIPLSLQTSTEADKSLNPKERYILCVSSFNKRKNIATLVAAFQALKQTGFKLVLAGGSGDTSTDIKRMIDADSSIVMFENISNAQKNGLYFSCSFCVYPSIFEGFGIPILEAFHFGKTTVASNSSSLPEVGGNACVYFSPENKAELSDLLSFCMEDKNRLQLEALIPEQIQNFQSQKLLEEYSKIYYKLMN